MIVLEGQPALSPFRRERLEARLQTLVPDLRITGAWFTYWVEPEPGASPDMAALQRILEAGSTAQPVATGAVSRFVEAPEEPPRIALAQGASGLGSLLHIAAAADQHAAVREAAAPGLERPGGVGQIPGGREGLREPVRGRVERRLAARREDQEVPGARRTGGHSLRRLLQDDVAVRAADAEGA